MGWLALHRGRAVVIAAVFFGLVATTASAAAADGMKDEGQPTTVTGRVESVRAEEDGRVPVAVSPYAQLYFLHRSEPRFEDLLRLLKDAQATERPVRCTFRRFSGRILAVEWAEQDEAALWTGTAQVDVRMWEPGGEHGARSTGSES